MTQNIIAIKPKNQIHDGGYRELEVLLNNELISDVADAVFFGCLQIDVREDGTIIVSGRDGNEIVEDDFCGRQHRNLSTAFFKLVKKEMVIEECSELTKEICKRFRLADNWDCIAEEVADVEITLEQLKMIAGIGADVEQWKARKKSDWQKG